MFIYEAENTPTEVKKWLFCLGKNSNDYYHKVNIICDEDVGFYKIGICYCSISLKPLDILNDKYMLDEHMINRLTNVIAIPLVKKSNNNFLIHFSLNHG